MVKNKIIFFAFFLLSCCGQPPSIPGSIKAYFLEPTRGLVREQTKEIIPFDKARGYFCESKKDIESIAACIGGDVKIYFLEPTQGLIRRQAKEVKPFSEARGYYCTTQSDLNQLLDRCKT